MANVVTDYLEPANSPNIRAAILDYIPDDPNIQRDIKIHDGIADISIKWRTLRWSICMGLMNQTPDQIGRSAAESFRAWVVSTLNNMNNTPRHGRVLQEIGQWLSSQHDGVWADVERFRDAQNEYKWRIGEIEPVSNVTEFA